MISILKAEHVTSDIVINQLIISTLCGVSHRLLLYQHPIVLQCSCNWFDLWAISHVFVVTEVRVRLPLVTESLTLLHRCYPPLKVSNAENATCTNQSSTEHTPCVYRMHCQMTATRAVITALSISRRQTLAELLYTCCIICSNEAWHTVLQYSSASFNSSSATGNFSRQNFFTAERHGRLQSITKNRLHIDKSNIASFHFSHLIQQSHQQQRLAFPSIPYLVAHSNPNVDNRASSASYCECQAPSCRHLD